MAEAEFILSGGNGVKDWALFHQAAAALGATEGASRVAVDDGFMGRERQVGASGIWVTARVYVAVGYQRGDPASARHRRLRQGGGDQPRPNLRHDQAR